MTYKAQGYEIDLSKTTRLYPAVTINAGGETAQVSLEWAELKHDVIEVVSYVLVFDVDPLEEVPKNRIELNFKSRDALIEAMQEVSDIIKGALN
ncbi:MAG: hypothetical protein U9P71_07405 [Campylobacterota bacterium]|nr:hypothetical protein [Campylobacterota bacterium]